MEIDVKYLNAKPGDQGKISGDENVTGSNRLGFDSPNSSSSENEQDGANLHGEAEHEKRQGDSLFSRTGLLTLYKVSITKRRHHSEYLWCKYI